MLVSSKRWAAAPPDRLRGGSPVVAALHVTKRYRDAATAPPALSDVSVDIARGSMTAITGPSGSGKTTLLHCLSGVAAADSGSVLFCGVELVGASDRRRSELRRTAMSFVFQRTNLDPALTVAENVAIGPILRSESRARTQDLVRAALDRVGLAAKATSYPSELSGGEAQRAAVARAVAVHPDVVWADEPTGSLDSVAAADVFAVLRDLCASGVAVVVVTHAESLAAQADDMIRLQDGQRVS